MLLPSVCGAPRQAVSFSSPATNLADASLSTVQTFGDCCLACSRNPSCRSYTYSAAPAAGAASCVLSSSEAPAETPDAAAISAVLAKAAAPAGR